MENKPKKKSKLEKVSESYKESTGTLPRVFRKDADKDKFKGKSISEIYQEEERQKQEEEDSKLSLSEKISRGLRRLRGEE
jgi:carbamate kinase